MKVMETAHIDLFCSWQARAKSQPGSDGELVAVLQASFYCIRNVLDWVSHEDSRVLQNSRVNYLLIDDRLCLLHFVPHDHTKQLVFVRCEVPKDNWSA